MTADEQRRALTRGRPAPASPPSPLARLEAEIGFIALFDRFEVTDVDTSGLQRSPSDVYGLDELVATLS